MNVLFSYLYAFFPDLSRKTLSPHSPLKKTKTNIMTIKKKKVFFASEVSKAFEQGVSLI